MTQPIVQVGLERIGSVRPELKDARVGLVLHPASVDSRLRLAVDVLLEADFNVVSLFGPQHGARGEKQDNMIESDHYLDPVTGLPVHSLYSEVRKPTPEMLAGLDAVVFDLQDVGVRVYTFVWTMALIMEACAESGVRVVVLDRPNPVGLSAREGSVLRSGFESFVGLHPIPLRHGLTAGELARWLVGARGIDCALDVIECSGLTRSMTWQEMGLPWVMPSPNLPTIDSCVVYPGMVLLEGTNLSEGRGTTRPFELFGAPWLDAEALVKSAADSIGPGVRLRAVHFEPTFQKHAGRVCGGAQLHVTDPGLFQPVRATVALLAAVKRLAPEDFAWRNPPYEYEEDLAPIDILWGSSLLREGVDAGLGPDAILDGVAGEITAFETSIESHLLYSAE
ncbi:MAG: DUF1343 domain-containing protein [Gemmatimonadota bacterium]